MEVGRVEVFMLVMAAVAVALEDTPVTEEVLVQVAQQMSMGVMVPVVAAVEVAAAALTKFLVFICIEVLVVAVAALEFTGQDVLAQEELNLHQVVPEVEVVALAHLGILAGVHRQGLQAQV
jgi:hypothetical protein